MNYLLDTNIIIYALKNEAKIKSKLKSHSSDNVYMSSITFYELYYGAYKSKLLSKNIETIELLSTAFNILPFTYEDSICAGEIRASLEKKGKTIGPYDILLAAQALSNVMTLVTNNDREFKRIKNLCIENWMK